MNSYLASIGPALANHLWQSTAFALLAALFTLALRRNRARIRYAIWLAASVKFLVPFSLLVAAGNLLPHPAEPVAPAVYSAMDVVEEPFAVPDLPPVVAQVYVPTLRERAKADLPTGLAALWLLGVAAVLFAWCNRWRRVSIAMRQAVPTTEGREFEILRRLRISSGLVPQGFSLGSPAGNGSENHGPLEDAEKGRALIGRHFSAGNKGNINTRALAPETSVSPSLAPSLAPEGRSRRLLRSSDNPLPLLMSAQRMEPGIFGAFRPVLVWPQQLSAHLDDAHIEAILAHELAHVRRRDNLTALLHMAVEAAFWFHPLVWWMERQMVKQREQACDEAVVAMGANAPNHVPGHAPDYAQACAQTYAEIYAEGLLKTCRFCIESPLPCVAGVTGADLKRRVADIVTGRALLRLTWPKKLLLAAAAVCVIAAPVVLGQARAAQHLMLAVINAAPKPLHLAAHTLIPEIEAQAIDEIAEIQPPNPPAANAMPLTAPPTPPTSPGTGAPGPPKTMAADAVPKFEVVTAKPSNPTRPGDYFTFRGRQMMTVNTSVNELITFAYGVHPRQLLGGPDWLKEKFDLDGVPDVQGEPSEKQMRLLVRNALETRFGLKFHHEKRELSVYVLSVAKSGPKMTVTAAPSSAAGNFFFRGGPGRLNVTNSTMKSFCEGMQEAVMDKPVIDLSGLADRYDFNLNWTPDESQFAQIGGYRPPPQEDPNAPPSLFAAIQEQLGLKLGTTKARADVMVIDHIEKPGEN